jgi:hypothetical protein
MYYHPLRDPWWLILQHQILTFNGDNATSNDKQTTRLHRLPNAFEAINRIRCFNHTIQLSAKALLCPFTSTIVSDAHDSTEANNLPDDDSDIPDLIDDEEDQDEDEGDGSNVGDNEDDDEDEDGDDDDDDNTFETLSDEEREQLINDTAAVRTTLDKVCAIVTIF